MASIGCPILGDSKYGNNSANRELKLKYQALCAWELAHQFLQIGTFGQAVGRAVVYKGVLLHFHLCGAGGHLGLFHQFGILQQDEDAGIFLAVLLCEGQVLEDGLVAHIGDAQDVIAGCHSRQFEGAVVACLHTCSHGAVFGCEQGY